MKTIIINENQFSNVIKNLILERKNLNPRNLKFGDRGEDVKELQRQLMKLGYLKTKSMVPTGYFGNLTKIALDKYNGIKNEKQSEKTNTTNVGGLKLSDTLSDMYKFEIEKNKNRISSKDSVPNLINPKTTECAQFVNNLSDKYSKVGDAWLAHNNQSLGNLIWSAFNPLPKDKIQPIIDAWKKIDAKGGPKPVYNKEIANLINSIVPNKINLQLQLDDIVGIFNPSSKHHEEALYYAGDPYFSTFLRSEPKPKESLLSGKGFGLNTHVGIVGAIKNGVPIIFHNVTGTVMMDPYNRLSGGMKIAWVRRK